MYPHVPNPRPASSRDANDDRQQEKFRWGRFVIVSMTILVFLIVPSEYTTTLLVTVALVALSCAFVQAARRCCWS